MKEALKLALEALEKVVAGWTQAFAEYKYDSDFPSENQYRDEVFAAIAAIKEALAQPEQDNTYGYASRLATAIWQKHYMKDAPKWKPLNTTEGVLTQIDNMTCGLVKEKPAQPEQEPVRYKFSVACRACGHLESYDMEINPYTTTPPQRTWVGLTEAEANNIYKVASTFGEMMRMVEAKLKEKNYE